MSTLNKIITRLRMKLRDTDAVRYSKYEVLDAINETMRELKSTVTRFYDQLNFIVPAITDLIGENDTGWPNDFDELIIEYTLILLSPGDYGAKEQAKMLWQEKVISLTSTMSNGPLFIHGKYGMPTQYVDDDGTVLS